MLRILDSSEINRILKSNFGIWSPGLDFVKYCHFQWRQLSVGWGRRHIEYFGYVSRKGELLASCKRYKLSFQSRGKNFKVAGVGALFVPEEWRGRALGAKLLKALARRSREEGFDALYLNSDIGSDYYRSLGFLEFEAEGFSMTLSDVELQRAIGAIKSSGRGSAYDCVVRSAENEDVSEMCRHHRRWLARQDYGICRSEEYWRFKLERESYLARHSRLNWPSLCLITADCGAFDGGYALVEQGGNRLRVLEVIGPEPVFNTLWAEILRLAQVRKVRQLRGWRKMAPPQADFDSQLRDWSLPMILPLDASSESQVSGWTEIRPASVLELDHF